MPTCNHPPVNFLNTHIFLIKSFSYVLLTSLVYLLNNTIIFRQTLATSIMRGEALLKVSISVIQLSEREYIS